MVTFQPTSNQQQAIVAKGHNILVSASAGSGKTAVLTQRVIHQIFEEKVNIDELLIVTFTEAAALEMKRRIETTFKEKMAGNQTTPAEKKHFKEQLRRLPLAHISTLHAFCKKVIQRYGYLLEDFDPQFQLLTDATETRLLLEEIWEDYKESHYDKEDFIFLSDALSGTRNDEELTEFIFTILNYARSTPDPLGYLNNIPKSYEEQKSIALYQTYYLAPLEKNLEDLIEAYEDLKNWMLEKIGQENLDKKELEKREKFVDYCQKDSDFLRQLQHILKTPQEDGLPDFEAFHTLANEMKLVTDGIRNPSPLLKTAKAQRVQLRNLFFSSQKNYLKNELFKEPKENLEKVQEEAQKIATILSQVVADIFEAYQKRKNQLHRLDFNDLEYYANYLLDPKKIQSTLPQEYYQQKFHEVIVDEYQDINPLQDQILNACSNGKNRFMVGDVKQSIYNFRQASPDLFIKKYEGFAKSTTEDELLLLPENFRSRMEILNFVNLIFQQLMTKSLGEVSYDDKAMLKQLHQEKQKPEVEEDFYPEMLVYLKNGSEKEATSPFKETQNNIEEKVAMVAQKITELLAGSEKIYKKNDAGEKVLAPIEPEDIAILVPTRSYNLEISQIFNQYGLTIAVSDMKNYFQALEVQLMLSLLHIIDNPNQDIPLTAVLRSFMFAFTERDLVKIRLLNPQKEIYPALLDYQLRGEDEVLREKVNLFLEHLTAFRQFKNGHTISQLIYEVYEETAFLEYAMGLENGLQKRENLLILGQKAKEYEAMSYRGLFQFIQFIKKMQEKDDDIAQPLILTENQAIQLMTIHGSKGLEFPVVFVMNLDQKMNLKELGQKIIVDKDLGVGLSYVDEENVKHYSLPYESIKMKKRYALLAEEMRKLYVALTRAEQKLYLVGSSKDQETLLHTWGLSSFAKKIEGTSQPFALNDYLKGLGPNNLFDWVGMTLARHPLMETFYYQDVEERLEDLGEEGRTYLSALQNGLGAFKLQFYKNEDLKIPLQKEVKETKRQETAYLDLVKEKLAYQYPYMGETVTTSYQSVTEIKQVFTDPDENRLVGLPLLQEKSGANRYLSTTFKDPEFVEKDQGVTPSVKGTATHLLMQLIPLQKVPTFKDFEILGETLIKRGILKKEVFEALDLEKMVAFFEDTKLGQEILVHQSQLLREQPFSMLLKAANIFPQLKSQDRVLVHGTVDGLYQTEAGYVLFDYKTDYLPKNQSYQEHQETLKNRYLGQLNLYKKAIEESTGQKVCAMHLISLSTLEIFTF